MSIFFVPGPLGMNPEPPRRTSGLNFKISGQPPIGRFDGDRFSAAGFLSEKPYASNKKTSVQDTAPEAVSEALDDLEALVASEKSIKHLFSLRDQAVYFLVSASRN